MLRLTNGSLFFLIFSGSRLATIENVDVSPCPEFPCVFRKGTNVTLKVTFIPSESFTCFVIYITIVINIFVAIVFNCPPSVRLCGFQFAYSPLSIPVCLPVTLIYVFILSTDITSLFVYMFTMLI